MSEKTVKRIAEGVASFIARGWKEDLTYTEWDELRDIVSDRLGAPRWRSGTVPEDEPILFRTKTSKRYHVGTRLAGESVVCVIANGRAIVFFASDVDQWTPLAPLLAAIGGDDE